MVKTFKLLEFPKEDFVEQIQLAGDIDQSLDIVIKGQTFSFENNTGY